MKKLFLLSLLLFYQSLSAEDITLSCEDEYTNKIKIMFDSDSLEKNAFITSQFYFEDYTDFTANVTVRYLGDEYFFYKINYFQEPKQCQIPDSTDPTNEEYLDALKCRMEKKEMSEEEPKPEVSFKIDRKSLVIQGQINSTRKGSFINNCTLQYEEYKF